MIQQISPELPLERAFLLAGYFSLGRISLKIIVMLFPTVVFLPLHIDTMLFPTVVFLPLHIDTMFFPAVVFLPLHIDTMFFPAVVFLPCISIQIITMLWVMLI
jgi:hypothetical protein